MGAVLASIRPRTEPVDKRGPRFSSLPPEPDRPPNLLAIAASPRVCEQLDRALKPAGYAPEIVGSVQKFWRRIAEASPDLVLIPEDLEGVCGPELCGELRMRQSTRHLSIITVACHSCEEQFVIRSLRAGADDSVCLARPAEFGARVAAQLRNSRYRNMLRQVRSERDVLRVVATRDPLTRIPNRRALDRTMSDRVEQGSAFGLLFLDIDHFKSINDEYGHDIGDEVLKRIARYLERGTRSNDFCGRYGGEEFLVIVDGADEELAAKVGERHRRAISALTFGVRGPHRPVTLSVGVASYRPDAGLKLEEVMRNADKALYRAKGNGRNQIVVASQVIDSERVDAQVPLSVSLDDTSSAEAAPDNIEKALLAALSTKSASLPVLPEIATEALHIANDPDANLQKFASLVDHDPHIAARFISIANSVIYSRGFKTTTTSAAIVRVGLHGARDILFQVVYSASAVGLPRYQDAVTLSFRRSVLAGIAARRAARMLGSPFPYAYLAGLLHDIGEARVYRILASMPQALSDAQAEELVARYHCRAGVELAEAWSLPEEIVRACGSHHDPEDQSLPVRLVRLADAVVNQIMPPNRTEPNGIWYEPFGLKAQQAEKLVEEVTKASEEMSYVPPPTKPSAGSHASAKPPRRPSAGSIRMR